MENNEVFNKFTQNAGNLLKKAQKLSQNKQLPLSTEYLLYSIVITQGTLSHDILKEYSITKDQIELVMALAEEKGKLRPAQFITAHVREVLKKSFQIASDFGHFNVDVEHILIALLSDKSYGSYKVIENIGIDPESIKVQLINIFNDLAQMDEMIKKQPLLNSHEPNPAQEDLNPPVDMPFGPMQATGTISKPNQKILEFFATDLVAKAKKGEIDNVVGRELEIDRAIQILLRKTKNNPVFIGEPGVGKTAVVEGLARRIAFNKVPSQLINKKIFQLDLSLMVAGTIYRGQFEDRIKKMLAEIKENKDAIIFIDEIHTIVGTGSAEGSIDTANILKPSLSKNQIRLIGATTLDEYRKYIEKDPALERRLQPVLVKEPSVEETVSILQGIRKMFEQHHQIEISDEAIEAATKLSDKYINDRFLPDKAIDLLDEAAAEKVVKKSKTPDDQDLILLREKINSLSEKKENLIKEENFEQAAKIRDNEMKLRSREALILKSKTNKSNDVLTDKDITLLLSKITGIPLGEIEEGESQRLINLEKELSKFIVGQNEAIHEIARSIKRNRSGISNHKRPIGSFVFLGPSGVGKTEMARALATNIYGRKEALIKIDMSEFMERHNVARLTGAPPGYVGYEDAGKLTEAVRKNPYSIVLFDEIEKAHPEVFNILLQILDDGTLSDSRGRLIDFKNTIVILTSNIGIDEYQNIKRIGFDRGHAAVNKEEQKGQVESEIYEFFRPELVNRLDKVIVFNPLEVKDLAKIAKIHLDNLKANLKAKDYILEYNQPVLDFLANLSFEQFFGARPLIKAIEELIEDKIAELIISGAKKDDKKISITVKNKAIAVR